MKRFSAITIVSFIAILIAAGVVGMGIKYYLLQNKVVACATEQCFVDHLKTCTRASLDNRGDVERTKNQSIARMTIEKKEGEACKFFYELFELPGIEEFNGLTMTCLFPLKDAFQFHRLINEQNYVQDICEGPLVDATSDTCFLMLKTRGTDAADYCYATQASVAKNPALCDKISNPEKQTPCRIQASKP